MPEQFGTNNNKYQIAQASKTLVRGTTDCSLHVSTKCQMIKTESFSFSIQSVFCLLLIDQVVEDKSVSLPYSTQVYSSVKHVLDKSLSRFGHKSCSTLIALEGQNKCSFCCIIAADYQVLEMILKLVTHYIV